MATSFKVNVDDAAEEYQLTCTSPVAVVGDWVEFGQPAFVTVAGIVYWCHFDQARHMPEAAVVEGQDLDTVDEASEAEVDAANEAAARELLVRMVGHGTRPVVEFVESDEDDEDDDDSESAPAPDGPYDDEPDDIDVVDQPEETGESEKEN